MEKSAYNKKNAEFVQWMRPILDALQKLGNSGTYREVTDLIANNLKISEFRRQEKLKSGVLKFPTQVIWAGQCLVWEGLLKSSRGEVWTLTEKGKNANLNEQQANEIFFKWLDIIVEAREAMNLKQHPKEEQCMKENTPLTDKHRQEFLDLLSKLPPAGFEKLCLRLLRQSGFEKISVNGGSTEEGIDGVGFLQINPFVTLKILFQFKQQKNPVSRAQVGDFRNAMLGRADKGILITPGDFTEDAVKEANRDGAPPIDLMNGNKLVEMFEKNHLGLTPKTIYEIDHTFFQLFFTGND